MAEIEAPDSTGWSASHYNKEASFVYSPAFTAPVLELLSAKPGERIIDFGCGSGELTLEIEKLVKCNNNQKGMVVGVDFSESMVSIKQSLVGNPLNPMQISKARLNGLEHAFVSDIQALAIPGEYAFNGPADKFDAVFSSAALHWCKRDPRGVLASVKRVLKPGGRFVGEMGGFGNVIGSFEFLEEGVSSWLMSITCLFVGVRSCLHTVLREQGHDPRNRDPWYFPSPEEYSRV